MKTFVASLKSTTPMSQGRAFDREIPKLAKESSDDYEKRTWRNRMHVDQNGNVLIPAFAFKNCLDEAAKFVSVQIPGKGKATYTKHFQSGVLVLEPLNLGIKRDNVRGEWRFVPSNGQPGGGKRVYKCFPVIDQWKGDVTFHVLDETITEDVLKEHLEQAGLFIGIGSFRPKNRGIWGRFEVTKVKQVV